MNGSYMFLVDFSWEKIDKESCSKVVKVSPIWVLLLRKIRVVQIYMQLFSVSFKVIYLSDNIDFFQIA